MMRYTRSWYWSLGELVTIGSLLGVGFVVPELWWLSLVGLVWFIVNIVSSSRRQAALSGGIVFFVCNIWALSWFSSVPPVDWLPIPDQFVWILILVFWLTSALWLSLVGPVFAILMYEIYHRTAPWVLVPVFTIGWVGAEVTGSLLFSVFFMGPGGTININNSGGYIGYHLAQHASLFHLSAWGGVYILSAALALVAGVIWLLWQNVSSKKTKTALLAGISVLLLASALPSVGQYVAPEVVSPELSVLVLETQFVGQLHQDFIPSDERTQMFTDIFTEVGSEDFDYIVLPEDSRFTAGFGPRLFSVAYLRSLFGTSTAQMIDSGANTEGDRAVIRGEIIDLASMDRIKLDKQYLVPQGEYLPYLYTTVFQWLGFGDKIAEIEADLSYSPGPHREQRNLDQSIPRILFCFESVNPRGVRQIIDPKTSPRPLVVHPLSHAWFNEPTILHHQLDTMLRVQARWNNVFIVSAGNKAPSKLYAPDGSVVSSTDKKPLYSNEHIAAYHFQF